MALAGQKCKYCEVSTPPLPPEAAKRFSEEVPRWTLKEKSLEREFKFKHFMEAIDFLNEVARVAEKEGHHPDIHIYHNKVRLELATHKIGGLSENDFVLAAKIDGLI